MRVSIEMAKMARQAKWAAALAAVAMAGAAQAALDGRDIDGNPVDGSHPSAVFLYDTDRDITWLRDANVNGRIDWLASFTWADNLVVGIFDDWRLPQGQNPDGLGPCNGFNCTGSEIGHLWYAELGNTAGALTNTGDFQNLQSSDYWFLNRFTPRPNDALSFDFRVGSQNVRSESPEFPELYAMAVRDGDVAAGVPEVQTYAMLLAGLGVVGLMARRGKTA